MAVGSFSEATWSERSVFFLYMILWIAYGLLNQKAKYNNDKFNPTTVVYVQECLKLVLSIGLFFFQDGCSLWQQQQLRRNTNTNTTAREQQQHLTTTILTMVCWYLIPAGLYALTDVLVYVNIRSFDPATYYLLSEMKLVLTAVISQVLFGRKLNLWHWCALMMITAGCALKTMDSLEYNDDDDNNDDERGGGGGGGSWSHHPFGTDGDGDDDDYSSFLTDAGVVSSSSSSSSTDLSRTFSNSPPTLGNYLILLLQIFASTTAGVYNEMLLKSRPSIPVNVQNICLYVDGILLLTLLGFVAGLTRSSSIDDDNNNNNSNNNNVQQSLADALAPSALLDLLFLQPNPTVLCMVWLMSTAGIITSRFLKIFDSVRKSIALALVVVIMPFLSKLCFGTAVTLNMFVSILCVVAGMHMYSSQPVPSDHLALASTSAVAVLQEKKAFFGDNDNDDDDDNNNNKDDDAESLLPYPPKKDESSSLARNNKNVGDIIIITDLAATTAAAAKESSSDKKKNDAGVLTFASSRRQQRNKGKRRTK